MLLDEDIQDRLYLQTNRKLVKSGHLLEIYQFGRDIKFGPKYRKEKLDKNLTEKQPPDQKESLLSSARRARRIIKRLIHANCFFWFNDQGKAYRPVTLTLTFAKNIQDLKIANQAFTKFIKRLNYEANKIEGREVLKQNNLKYLAVFELQKRGAIHYHCIFFNLPFIPAVYNRLRDVWGQGCINVNGDKKAPKIIKKSDKLILIVEYFIKYIQKSILYNSFPQKKKYMTSKELLKPKECCFDRVVMLVENKLSKEDLVYKYDGEYIYNNQDILETVDQPKNYLHWFNYWRYDLSEKKKLSQLIDGLLEHYS